MTMALAAVDWCSAYEQQNSSNNEYHRPNTNNQQQQQHILQSKANNHKRRRCHFNHQANEQPVMQPASQACELPTSFNCSSRLSHLIDHEIDSMTTRQYDQLVSNNPRLRVKCLMPSKIMMIQDQNYNTITTITTPTRATTHVNKMKLNHYIAAKTNNNRRPYNSTKTTKTTRQSLINTIISLSILLSTSASLLIGLQANLAESYFQQSTNAPMGQVVEGKLQYK